MQPEHDYGVSGVWGLSREFPRFISDTSWPAVLGETGWAGVQRAISDLGVYELLARIVMLILAFIPFFAFWEVGRVLGGSKLAALFFSGQTATSPSDLRD